MFKQKAKNLLLTALVAGVNIHAEEISVNINNVANLAIKRNENAIISHLEIENAKNEVSKARSSLFPVFKGSASIVRSRTTPSLFSLGQGAPPIFNNWQRSANVGLSQPVYTFGRLSGGIELAKSSLNFAQSKSDVTISEIEFTAKSLFYNILFYETYLQIAKDSYDNVLKNSKALNKRVSYGRISQNQNLKMSADLASRKPLVIEAEKNLLSLKLQLKSFLGLLPSDKINVSGSLKQSTSNLDSDTVLNWSSLAQVKFLEDQLDMQKNLLDIEQSNYMPIVSFEASYGRLGFYEDFNDNNFLTQDVLNVGLMISFDIPSGGEKSFQQSIAQTNTRISELSLQNGKRELQIKIKDLTQKHEKLTEQIKSNLNAVDLAEKSYKVALRSFSSGSVTQTQLNDSELLLTQNKINLASNYLESLLVKVEIEKLKTEATKE
jgi:outer membrane protein